MAIDPACGVEIDPDEAATTIEHGGRTYYFCSDGCADVFVADPESHLEEPRPHLMTIGGLLTQKLPFKTDPEAFDLQVAEAGKLGVGDRSTFTKTITDEDVRKFAEASGDTNALHLDDQRRARRPARPDDLPLGEPRVPAPRRRRCDDHGDL